MLKKRFNKIINEFTSHWKNYVFQSFFATVVIFIVLLILNLGQAVIIASIAASTFIVFTMPRSITAKPKNVIGGHLVGLICGTLFSLIQAKSLFLSITILSLAVGISIFIMIVINTEHPPAAATALGIAIEGFSLNVFIAVIISAIVLSLIHQIFKKNLRDLT